jgi:hypothetical protein
LKLGGIIMHGCCGCGCKGWLKIIFGVLLILVGAQVLGFNPWIILGLYLALKGLMPMMCKCDECSKTEGKKK